MIDHQHLTLGILTAMDEGRIRPEEVLRQLFEAAQACEPCRIALDTWRQRRRPKKSILRLLEHAVAPTAEETRTAEKDFRTLLEMPPDVREEKVRRANKRYRSAVLTERLLAMSDEKRPVDPDTAFHLAELAQVVIHRCASSAQADDLRVLCLTYLAAADKTRGKLDAAAHRFRAARSTLKRLQTPGVVIRARLDYLEGAYYRDRRQLNRAEKLFSHTITLYELLGDPLRTAHSRLSLSTTQFYAGREEHAIATVKLALTAIDPKKEPRLFLMAHHNIALYLCEAGQILEAAKHFKMNEPRYELARHDWPGIGIHFHWLAGKIQRGLGKLPEAENHLVRARDGFAEHGTSYDAILVCLDLALVYAASHRTGQLSELAELMVSGFAAQGLHDEALAVVRIAAQAAREERLTQDLARKISHYLQFAQHDPALKYRID